MIQHRPFRNCDPPAIARIWCSQPNVRGVFAPMTPAVLETVVLSKPYFDRNGLIVAVEDDQPVGFVHAGFQSNAAGSALDTSVGATCMLMVASRPDRERIAADLLAASERYLQHRGAAVWYGGGSESVAPFYLGLYGGAALPGILADDRALCELFRSAGYVEQCRRLVLQCSLVGFRPVMDRQQLQIRRTCVVEPTREPWPLTWWDACSAGVSDFFQFAVRARSSAVHLGRACFWNMEPLASSWGAHARGLKALDISPAENRVDLTTFLLGESLAQMAAEGGTLAEVHAAPHDTELVPILHRLGFRPTQEGIVFCKSG